MSTSDKTGAKLVDSMRKTKAAAGDNKAGSANPPSGAAKDKIQSRTKKKSPSGGRRPSGGAKPRSGDPYQSGRRIWPD